MVKLKTKIQRSWWSIAEWEYPIMIWFIVL